MKTIRVLGGTTLAVALGLALAFAQSGYDLFQQALVKERAEGNPKAAIQICERIVKEFSSDRELAAKALVEMGECYEKLGKEQARQAYERVLRDYPDQSVEANEARARLASLEQGGASAEKPWAGVVIKELKVAMGQGYPALSPDGKKVVYSGEWENGDNLFVCDLASGAKHQITNVENGETAWHPVWSPDGKRVVYERQKSFQQSEMRILSLESGEDRGTGINGIPRDWTKDGRFIFFQAGEIGQPQGSLNLLPTNGGPPRKLSVDVHGKAFDSRLSPDGKYIAYSTIGGVSQEVEVYVAPVGGGESVQVTHDPSKNYNPIWAPDGKALLFLTDRALGRIDLRGAFVASGEPTGRSFLVEAGVGKASLWSLSDEGELLLSRSQSEIQIYVTTVNPATNQPVGTPKKLTSRSGAYVEPAWSPDGKQIAYYSGGDGSVLRLMSADGSNDHEVAKLSAYWGRPAWAPDNDHIYFVSNRPPLGTGIYSISTTTKKITRLLVDQQLLGHISISPDGTRLAVIRGLKHYQICVADADGKNLRPLTFDDGMQAAYPVWSPDGKQLAYFAFGSGKEGLMLISPNGGAAKELLDGKVDGIWDPTWAPDGKMIAWDSRVTEAGGGNGREIRMINPSGGGEYQSFPVNLGTSVNIVMQPSWSPDGKKMLFAAGSDVDQVLVLENFLPRLKASR